MSAPKETPEPERALAPAVPFPAPGRGGGGRAPGSARPSIGPDPRWLYAVFAAALAICFLGLQWLVDARRAAALHDHEAAVSQAAGEPGRLVTDPALPAGVLVVDLVPVSSEMPLEQPARIRAGAQRSEWTTDAPARFEGLPDGRLLALQISGPYATESASIAAPAGSRGARVAVRAIPVQPARPVYSEPGFTPERWMELDLTRLGVAQLRWNQGNTVVSETTVPRGAGHPALATAAQDEWKQMGGHRDVADCKLDQAVVRIGPGTTFDEIRWAVQAILRPHRTMNLGGSIRNVPVFNVEVEPPLDGSTR